jgi:hypothetical protein
MTRAMPKAVVIRGGESLPLMPKIWSAKRVRIVGGMLPPASLPVTLQSTVPAHALGQVGRMRHDVVLAGGPLLKSPVRAGRFGGLIG